MKKAKIILTVITLLAIVGGTLAFKAIRFNGTPTLAVFIADETTLSSFTVGPSIYTATIPYCVTTNAWRTPVGDPIQTYSTTTNAAVKVTATLVGGLPTQTRTFAFVYCTPFFTATTNVQ